MMQNPHFTMINGAPSNAENMRNQLMLIRMALGLSPIHDPVTAVRVLYEEGKEAFEKMRGEKCEYAHEWRP